MTKDLVRKKDLQIERNYGIVNDCTAIKQIKQMKQGTGRWIPTANPF